MRIIILAGLAFLLCSCMAETTAETVKVKAVTTAAVSLECNSDAPQVSAIELANTPLPERSGARIQTSGRVPHVQVGVEPVAEVNQALFKLAFMLPDLEEHPTIVSLPGAIGMWLAEGVPVAYPKAIVSGREFAHIHTDGSLHTPLPLERALELEQKGWGERHPWADRREGWEGLVMLYSASTEEELKTLIQLITESYNHVTGRTVSPPGC